MTIEARLALLPYETATGFALSLTPKIMKDHVCILPLCFLLPASVLFWPVVYLLSFATVNCNGNDIPSGIFCEIPCSHSYLFRIFK